MPALFLPIGFLSVTSAAETNLPVLFQSTRLPDCPITVIPVSSGTVWQQELRVNGFVIGQQLVTLRSAGTLTCHCAVESAVLLFVLQGRLSLEAENGTLGHLREKRYGLITSKADNPVVFSLPEGDTHLFQLAFSLRMLRKFPGQALTTHSNQEDASIHEAEFSGYQLTISTAIQQLLNKLLSIGSKPSAYSILRVNEICLRLLKRFIDDRTIYYAQQRWIAKKQLSITELAAFLSDHLDVASRMQVTLLACAKRMQLDIGLFQRIFKSHYGVTLSKYLHQQRMQRAFFLLSQSGQLPGEVYGEVGYRNFSSFSRAFSGHFGHPPSTITTENT